MHTLIVVLIIIIIVFKCMCTQHLHSCIWLYDAPYSNVQYCLFPCCLEVKPEFECCHHLAQPVEPEKLKSVSITTASHPLISYKTW